MDATIALPPEKAVTLRNLRREICSLEDMSNTLSVSMTDQTPHMGNHT